MIGFPLTLPIEATSRRSFYLEDGIKDIFNQNGERLPYGRVITLSIRLTEAEAVAVRTWLQNLSAPCVDLEDPGL